MKTCEFPLAVSFSSLGMVRAVRLPRCNTVSDILLVPTSSFSLFSPSYSAPARSLLFPCHHASGRLIAPLFALPLIFGRKLQLIPCFLSPRFGRFLSSRLLRMMQRTWRLSHWWAFWSPWCRECGLQASTYYFYWTTDDSFDLYFWSWCVSMPPGSPVFLDGKYLPRWDRDSLTLNRVSGVYVVCLVVSPHFPFSLLIHISPCKKQLQHPSEMPKLAQSGIDMSTLKKFCN